MDYCVVIVQHRDLSKLTNGDSCQGSEKKCASEVLSIGRTIEESMQKALPYKKEHGLEIKAWEDYRPDRGQPGGL